MQTSDGEWIGGDYLEGGWNCTINGRAHPLLGQQCLAHQLIGTVSHHADEGINHVGPANGRAHPLLVAHQLTGATQQHSVTNSSTD